MLCERASLLTNVTRVPAGTDTSVELTPADVMVIVAALSDGEEGEPPPHAPSTISADSGRSLRTADYRMRPSPTGR